MTNASYEWKTSYNQLVPYFKEECNWATALIRRDVTPADVPRLVKSSPQQNTAAVQKWRESRCPSVRISRLAVRVPAVSALICLAACSGDDTGWQGGTVMTIHWEHYKDAAAICHKLEAESIGEDPRSFKSEPVDGCRKVEGKDCYVYTGERTKATSFGDLLQDCFETREAEIDRETKP